MAPQRTLIESFFLVRIGSYYWSLGRFLVYGGDFNIIRFTEEYNRRGIIPFRYENMWLKNGSIMVLVKKWWEGLNLRGSRNYVISEKLKALNK